MNCRKWMKAKYGSESRCEQCEKKLPEHALGFAGWNTLCDDCEAAEVDEKRRIPWNLPWNKARTLGVRARGLVDGRKEEA